MVMIVADDQRNAKLISPAYEYLSVGVQQGSEYLEAHAGGRLLPDKDIV